MSRATLRRIVLVNVSVIVLALVVLTVLVWFGQRSLMYFPDSGVPPPADVGLPDAEVVDFETEDGLRLGAWFVRPRAQHRGYTAIVFNGNAGHRAYRARLAQRLSGIGVAVLLFDYRGYGGNPGLPYEAGLRRDARGALKYVRSRSDVDPRRIVFFGESLGTGVAVGLAVEYAPAALVLRSPFTSFVVLAERHYPFLPARWLLRDRYDSLARIRQVTSPVLVIAGDNDRIVPFEDSQMLYEHAPDPKRLVVVRGADHNDDALTDGPEIARAVGEWLGQ
jgi:fermentation-respiration switch protein FrsA (DUF1100 family)